MGEGGAPDCSGLKAGGFILNLLGLQNRALMQVKLTHFFITVRVFSFPRTTFYLHGSSISDQNRVPMQVKLLFSI